MSKPRNRRRPHRHARRVAPGSFPSLLTEFRLDREMHIEDLGARVGLTGGRISHFQCGQFANRIQREAIAQALDANPSLVFPYHELLLVSEVAERLGLTHSRARTLIDVAQIQMREQGGRSFVHEGDLAALRRAMPLLRRRRSPAPRREVRVPMGAYSAAIGGVHRLGFRAA
jgi:hypothetical protein